MLTRRATTAVRNGGFLGKPEGQVLAHHGHGNWTASLPLVVESCHWMCRHECPVLAFQWPKADRLLPARCCQVDIAPMAVPPAPRWPSRKGTKHPRAQPAGVGGKRALPRPAARSCPPPSGKSVG